MNIESLLPSLFNLIPQLCFATESGRVIYANKKAEEQFANLLVGELFSRKMVGKELWQLYGQLMEEKNEITQDISISRDIRSEYRDYLTVCKWCELDGGTFQLFTLSDITAHIHNARKLLLHQRRMAKVGKKASQVIHDLKNPLGVISGFADLLSYNETIDSDGKELIKNIQKSVQSIEHNIAIVTSYSVGRKLPLNFEEVDLLAWLSFVVKTCNKDGNILLERTTECRAVLDRDKMSNVLWNLIRNAQEVLRESEDGRIWIAYRCLKETVEISVKDNGPGIPDEIRYSLFETGKTFGKKGGHGIGLNSAYETVNAHDGTIRVDSNELGTEFIIELPKIQKWKNEEVVNVWNR